MKLPIKCPTCGDVMLTEYQGDYIILKRCSKRLNHNIEVRATAVDDEVIKITISFPATSNYRAVWHVLSKELRIINPIDSGPLGFIGTSLPYFEPDLSNYPKLIDKIKTYLVFS